ncbi:helix-turn-helix domain-containing protein [Dyadobacter sp. LJ53]|uniref:helix-turn-helix domain-containing protein n=1 Tax=Dyadobacter chenwenxiniae TaxID=2906456 RepID=UPI001F25ED58|nr:helix-turn-helix domain-containing protein [Dyadobacter chenwenxiniae]MCF0052598.1 helix-turn-helix domain-containing protein [Dyadobacter chenwenxiniae]
MQILSDALQVPVYDLEAEEPGGNKHFRVYNFEGHPPHHADLLIPHRKDHYLFVLIRQAGGTRQWLDMAPFTLQDNTVYFSAPNQIIVKEGFAKLWATGIAFTDEFLSLQESASLSKLPVIRNPQGGHKLALTESDRQFVEDLLAKINVEYRNPGEWQQRMLGAYLSVLLTYLSRLYVEQYKEKEISADKMLLKSFLSKVNECFRELHEVGEYASLLHISAGHLSEEVKMQSGKPAIKHIHERLTLEARRLLFHTNYSSKEIAFDLGFAEASYFNRFFKRETGQTPAEFRASIREMYH